MELDGTTESFDESVRQYARPSEATAFDNLARTAQRSIDNNVPDFESHLDDLHSRNFHILWRQDWYVIDHFKRVADQSFLSTDASQHVALVEAGREALGANEIDKLRAIVAQLYSIRIDIAVADDDMSIASNIVRG